MWRSASPQMPAPPVAVLQRTMGQVSRRGPRHDNPPARTWMRRDTSFAWLSGVAARRVSGLRSAMSQTRADNPTYERWVAYGFALATLAFILSVPAIGLPAKKPLAGLEGSWSGGGTVSFASGSTERASCRAHYSRAGSNSYTLNATCATASGRASQTASVRQVAENRYAGTFYNSEYGISGVISVVVHGRSQTVRLRSDSGSAVISLSR
jgi:hypothetical protein